MSPGNWWKWSPTSSTVASRTAVDASARQRPVQRLQPVHVGPRLPATLHSDFRAPPGGRAARADGSAVAPACGARRRRERGIVLRSLREGIDTSNATGRMVAGVLASLAELELELGHERRSAAREARRARGQSIGRPKALDDSKAALAQRMHASGEPARTIASALGVSRATVYRVLAEQSTE
jgi:helix-turn-helix resolvase-like protein/resolvase-like protein